MLCSLGIQTWDHNMVGADRSTEILQPQLASNFILLILNVLLKNAAYKDLKSYLMWVYALGS